jgi:hypothetical protein
MRPILSVVLLLCALTPFARAGDLQTVTKTFKTDGAHDLRIDFPAGELTIVAADVVDVSATMTARCNDSDDYSDCEERAERVRLLSDVQGGTLRLKLEGLPKANRHGFSIELRLEVPKSLGLSVDMGAGEVDIRGMEDDVTVELGAGDATVHAPEQSIHSVRLTVGLGDATLVHGHDRIEGKGFISKSLRWHEGRGPARIEVDLGVGDIDVALD